MTPRKILASIAAAAVLSLVFASTAVAGDYYVYSCSSYGNTAPAFTPWTDAGHLTPDNACMQPAPGGGYRTLELNNPGFKCPRPKRLRGELDGRRAGGGHNRRRVHAAKHGSRRL